MTLPQEIDSSLSSAADITAIIKKRPLKKHQEIAIRFFEKFVNNCKATMLLLDAGLTDEPYTIHRLSMEHLFNISALLKDPSFLEQLQAYSEAQIPKALKKIKENEDKSKEPALSNKNKALLEFALNNYNQNPVPDPSYSIYNAAQKSELSDFYDSHYRRISLSHAHSTIASVLREGGSTEERVQLLTYVNIFLKIAVMLIEKEFNLERECP